MTYLHRFEGSCPNQGATGSFLPGISSVLSLRSSDGSTAWRLLAGTCLFLHLATTSVCHGQNMLSPRQTSPRIQLDSNDHTSSISLHSDGANGSSSAEILNPFASGSIRKPKSSLMTSDESDGSRDDIEAEEDLSFRSLYSGTYYSEKEASRELSSGVSAAGEKYVSRSGLQPVSYDAEEVEQIRAPLPKYSQNKEDGSPSAIHQVSSTNEHVALLENEVKILSFGGEKIPQIQISNKNIVSASPLSPSQIQISAKQTGSTKIYFWNEEENIYVVHVTVKGALGDLLRREFPNASLEVHELGNGVLISGYIDEARDISAVVNISKEYYPKVVTNIRIGGVHKVLLHVKILEVSRSKLRQLGFDWYQLFSPNGIVVSSAAKTMNSAVTGVLDEQGRLLIPSVSGSPANSSFTFQLVDGGNAFLGFLNALEENKLAKLIAEPTLVAASGSEAHFHSGGRVPIVISTLSNVDVEYEVYGVVTTFVPIVYGNGNIRLAVKTEYSEIDEARSTEQAPALVTRQMQTTVDMKAGHTLALAGLLNTKIEASRNGLPVISDLPYVGNLFGRVEHRNNEQELLIMVTPELVSGIDPAMLPECELGTNTRDPSDFELFMQRQIEVNCDDEYSGPQVAGGSVVTGPPPGMTVFQEGEVIEPGKLMDVNDIPKEAAPSRRMLPPVPPVQSDPVPGKASSSRMRIDRSARSGVPPSYQSEKPQSTVMKDQKHHSAAPNRPSPSIGQRAPLQPPARLLQRSSENRESAAEKSSHPYSLRTVVPPSLNTEPKTKEGGDSASPKDGKSRKEPVNEDDSAALEKSLFKKPLIRSSSDAGFSTTTGAGEKRQTSSTKKPPLPSTPKAVAAQRSLVHPVPLPPVRPAAYRESSVQQARPMALPPVQ